MTYNNGCVYTGFWHANKWHGEGKLVSQLDTLEGTWQNSKLHGFGIQRNANFIYEGDWENSRFDGIGTLIYSDSSIYTGNFIDGLFDGYGDLILANGDSYFGEWEKGDYSGLGRYNFSNGSVYDGQWLNGWQHGIGILTTAEYTYEGEWEEGWMNGEGQIQYANGDKYDGHFVENQRHGFGKYYFANGNVYEGEFIDDKMQGLGSFYWADGSVYDGEFMEGQIDGDGTLYINLNDEPVVITAHWNGSQMPEYVSMLFANGDLYEGRLIDGRPCDEGTWSNVKEGSFMSALHATNDWYKEHKETIDKVVLWTSVALAVVEITGAVVATVATGGAAAPALIAAGKVAGTTLTVINAVDASASIASASIDAYDAVQNGEDPTAAFTQLGTELAINAAFIFLPKALKKPLSKVLKSEPARKLITTLSTSATKAGRAIVVSITSKQAFKQIVQFTKDKSGKLVKKLSSTKVGRFVERMTVRPHHQFVSNKQYKKMTASQKVSLELGKEASGDVLGRNMLRTMSKSSNRKVALERLRAGQQKFAKGRAQAHHVVAGTSPSAQQSRKILQKAGIDINDPRNGIFLPMDPKSIYKGSLHGKHIAKYDEMVYKRLQAAVKRNGGKVTEEVIVKELDAIKKDLYKGRIKLLISGARNTNLSALYN